MIQCGASKILLRMITFIGLGIVNGQIEICAFTQLFSTNDLALHIKYGSTGSIKRKYVVIRVFGCLEFVIDYRHYYAWFSQRGKGRCKNVKKSEFGTRASLLKISWNENQKCTTQNV